MTYIEQLQEAIRQLYGCESNHVRSVPVTETFQGKPIWDGDVEVFNLIAHKESSYAYAWGYEDHKGPLRITVVLKLPPINSPMAAIKMAIIAKIKL